MLVILPIIIFFNIEQSVIEGIGRQIPSKLMPLILLYPGLFFVFMLWLINWTKKQKQCENCLYLSKPDATACNRCNHPHHLNVPIKNPLHEKYSFIKKNPHIFAGILLMLFELVSNYQEMLPKGIRTFWNKIITTTGDVPGPSPDTVEEQFESTESNP